MKKLFGLLGALALIFSFVILPAQAKAPALTLPGTASQKAAGVVPLGTAFDDGQLVEGFAIIHHKNGKGKPPWAGGGKNGNGKNKCYAFLAKGARWKVTEPYVLDETNNDGLTTQFVNSVTVASLETWDTEVAFEIFGSEDLTSPVDGADTVAPDNKNEIYFGNIADPGVIAVAIVWGVFGGPPQTRQLVEYDVIFDDTDYTWGDATQSPAVMDYQNIATHELGHGTGMGDLYESACSEETMYGYSTIGETKKRDLHTSDIAGIIELYK